MSFSGYKYEIQAPELKHFTGNKMPLIRKSIL